MAFKTFGTVPFPPLRIVDRDAPLESDWLTERMAEWGGEASILLRWENGPAQRGGYFFHLSRRRQLYGFHDFAGKPIIELGEAKAARLINHASGRAFDAEMLDLCQKVINLRQDD
jgi:hypothetical protein